MQEKTSLQIETHTISKKVIGGVLVLVMALILALIWQPDKATAANKKPSDLKMPKVGRIDELNTKASTFQVAYKQETPEIQYQSVEAEIENSRLMMQRRQASISVYKADNAPAVMEDERKRDLNKEFSSNPSVVQASAHQIEHLDYTIIQGKIITGILESAINSDLPGYIRAIVKENVYAEHGANLLIPKGSRLIGYYKSELDVGQKRVFIVWQRLIRPDGVEVNLNSPGTNHLGQAGLTGGIDTHFFERVGEAILLSLISAGSANINVDKADQYNSRSAYREAVSQSFADTASQSLNRTQGLGPTVHVPQGTIIKVFVAQDLNFFGALNKEVAHAKY